MAVRALVLIVGLTLLINAQYEPEGELVAVQILHRHGSRVPDAIPPTTEDFWRQFGAPGRLTSKGRGEMESLGRFMREKYIEQEKFLPEKWCQKDFYIQASAARYSRVLMSAKAVLNGFYPSTPVPIHTDDPDEDTVLFPQQTCPSYLAEQPRKSAELNADFQRGYRDLLTSTVQRTGWTYMTPTEVVYNIADNLHSERMHFHQMEPYFAENYGLITSLQTLLMQAHYLRDNDADLRGSMAAPLAWRVAENFKKAIEGSDVKMYWYVNHGEVLMSLWEAIGLGTLRFEDGAAMILELRQIEDGSYNVHLDYAYLQDDRISYTTSEHPLACPDIAMVCEFGAFYENVYKRNPEHVGMLSKLQDKNVDGLEAELGRGCCYASEGFFAAGCDDYLNPETLNIHLCYVYRKFCPAVACGKGNVVDQQTLLCRTVVGVEQ